MGFLQGRRKEKRRQNKIHYRLQKGTKTRKKRVPCKLDGSKGVGMRLA